MNDEHRLFIANAANIDGQNAAIFSFRDDQGILSDGFLIRTDGKLCAYRNQCRHQPISLDWGDGEFFTEDGKLLLCRNHGALFDPENGKCVAGPCAGASLHPLRIEEQDGRVYLLLPVASPVDSE